MLGALIVVFAVVALASFRFNQKIGQGKDWPAGNAILASVLMGLNSALCCGIIGYVVMQGIAAKEIKKYGVSAGFFGLKKRDIEAKIAELRAVTRPTPTEFSL